MGHRYGGHGQRSGRFRGPGSCGPSALLTAGYLLPVMVDGYFPGMVTGYEDDEKAEPNALMLIPMFILCAGSLLVGVFGSSFMGGLTF